jgi:hypothetical protein
MSDKEDDSWEPRDPSYEQEEKSDREKQERIEEIVQWTRAAYRVVGKSPRAIRRVANKGRSDLRKLPLGNIRKLHNLAKELLKENSAQQWALDKELFFNKPNAKANLDK